MSEEFEVYCKAAADTGRVGDCPFTSACCMALAHKGITFSLIPRTRENKDEWHLKEPYNGSMPCLRSKDGSVVITDSTSIVKFIDESLSDVSQRGVLGGAGQEAWKSKEDLGLFPAVAKYLKNTDQSKDAELEEILKEKLSQLDSMIETSGGPFILGSNISVIDFFTASTLYHLQSACETLKGTKFEELVHVGYASLQAYVIMLTSLHCYRVGVLLYTAEDVIFGWKQARGET